MFNSFGRTFLDGRATHVSGAAALALSSVIAGCASSPPPGAVPPVANRATVVLTCPDGAFALTGVPPPLAAPPPPPPAAPTKPPEPREDRHVYRFDFVLSGAQATNTPDTSFLLTLEEHRTGEALIGRNAPIAAPSPAPSAAGGAPSVGGARQDVGTKIRAKFESAEKGDDVVLDTDAEISSLEAGGSIRKITAHTQLVLAPGKPVVVVGVDEGPKHARLTVTATKLR